MTRSRRNGPLVVQIIMYRERIHPLSTPTYYSIWVISTAALYSLNVRQERAPKKKVVVTTKRNFWKKESLYQHQGGQLRRLAS